MGDGAEAPPVADAARRRREKQQADKAAPKLPPYAPIVFQGNRRFRVPPGLVIAKTKNDIRLDVVFMVQKEILNPNC